MSENVPSVLPPPSPDHRRVAAGQFERANQVIATGNFDYGIQLLRTCCKLDPGNLIYRQSLRRSEKKYYKNNLRGSRLAFLTTSATRTKLKAAKASRDYLRVLECGEEILVRNPWDVGTQMDMSEAAEALGLVDLAVWTLEQARQKDPKDATVNRALARLYEKRGNFSQAIGLWELVRKAAPHDVEAQHKGKDLAASATIARGNYESVLGHAPDKEGRGNVKPATEETIALAAPAGSAQAASPAPSTPLLSVAQERVLRETAGLRTRIEADPTNANAYLQLAGAFRRAGQIAEAKKVLEE